MPPFFSVARPQGLHRLGAAAGSRLPRFRSKSSWLSFTLLSALAPAFLAAPAAHADDFTLYEYVGLNQGTWFTPANWKRDEISVGGEFSKTLVARNLTARIEAPGAAAGIMFLGNEEETGTLVVGATGTLTMDLLLAGYQSSGYLDVSSGGHVTVAQETIIGHLADGFVTVTGAGSTYTHQFYGLGKAVVGSNHNGALTISNQGLAEFHALPLYIGGVGGAKGTVTVTSGGVLAAEAIEERNSAGSLILDGGILRALSDNRPLLNKFAAGHVSLGAAGGTIDTQSYRVTALSVMGGAGALIKTGTGTLVLSAANTYTGGTVIRDGTIEVSSDSYLGSAGGRVTFDGGTLAPSDGLTINRPMTVDSGGGTIRINGINLNGASATLAGDISGSGTLLREGTGDLYLTGNNTAFSGSFHTTSGGLGGLGGALVPRNNNALGSATVILDRGRLAIPGGVTVGNAVSLAAAGHITNFGADTAFYNGPVGLNGQTLTLTSLGAGGGSLTFGGSTSGIGELSLGTVGGTLLLTGNLNHVGEIEHRGTGGSGGVVKITGTIGANVTGVSHDSQNSPLILTGNNSYPGTTTNTQGRLQIGDGGTTGDLSGNIVNDGELVFHRSDSFTYAKNISGTGTLEKLGAGTLTFSGLVSHTGTTTISAGTLQIGTGSSVANLTGDIVNNGSLVLHHSGGFKHDHVISGSGNLIKIGSGETTLTGDNTFTGGTQVLGGVLSVGETNDSGALMAGVSGNAVTLLGGNLNLRAGSIRGGNGADVINGTGSAGGIGVVVDAPGSVVNSGTMSGGNGGNGIRPNSFAAGGIGGVGASFKAAASFTNLGTVAGGAGGDANNGLGHGAAGGAGVNFAGAGLLTNHGTITGGQGGVGALSLGAGGVGVVVTGGGAVVTQPGSMIQGGLHAFGGWALGLQFSTASTFVHQGAILGGVSMDNSAHTVQLFTGSSIVGGPLLIGSNPAATLTLDGVGSHSLSAAVPSGIAFAGSLKKQGSGTWTIDQNMAAGAASILEGKLLVTASIAGTLSTAPGTMVGGNGTIGGNASINGTLAPGLSAGKLTFSGDLTLGASGLTTLELGGTSASLFDQVSVDDALTYGGTLSLSLINGYAPAIGDTFQLFQDFNAQTGTFAEVTFTNPGVVGHFNYATGTLSVVAVPEPSSGLLTGVALFGFLARRRRGQSVA